MRKHVILTIFAATAVPSAFVVGASSIAQAQAGGELATVQSHLRAVTSMTADFTQTDRRGQVLAGKLTLKKPGKIRFEYQKGVPMLIVGDGSALTMIDYEVRQVQRWPIGNTPLAALIDPSKDLSKFGKVNQTSDPSVISIAVKDAKKPEYGEITMIFVRDAAAPGGLMLRGWVAFDSKNNRTTIRLSNQKFNAPVADSAFKWTDPRRSKASGR
jgi:outer membrane lipoprotein-sorting protein